MEKGEGGELGKTNRVEQGAENREDHLLVRARTQMRQHRDTLLRKRHGRHIHAFPSHGEKQPQDLYPIALKLLRRRHRCGAPHTALPYRICDLWLPVRHPRQCEAGVEHEVDQRVGQLLRQWPRLLKILGPVPRAPRGRGAVAVEEHLVRNGRAARAPPPRAPEEALLPLLQRLGLVDVGENAGQHADAVEGVAVGRELRVGEGRVVAEDEEARGQGQYERLEVLERAVAGPAYVGGGEKTEDVLGGLGELPELRDRRGLVSGLGVSDGYAPLCDGTEAWPRMVLGFKLTEVQYGSSAGIWRSSESLKIPFLKTSFESLAPILALSTDYHVRKERGREKLQSRCGEGRLIDAYNSHRSD